MTINPSMFPIPDSSYSTSGIRFDALAPIAILAWNLEIMQSEDNLFSADFAKRGHVLLRNQHVPLPRPATQLAWERVCRLGAPESKSFLVPFLPSITGEDEMGQAIAEKGIHIPSLSRKSNLHLRETITMFDGTTFEGIIWGECFRGMVSKDATLDSILDAKFERSNVVEALVTHRRNIWPETAQDSIRVRLEFIAQYGVPALRDFGKTAMLPVGRRILFQFVSQLKAAKWALAYSQNYLRIRQDPGLITADYRDMVSDMAESLRIKEEKKPEKNIPQKAGKQDFGAMEF